MLLQIHWIFTLDWILIDTVIIILLFIVLISVRIFKESYRWRFSLSNESLERRIYKKSEIRLKNLNLIVKSWSLIYNPEILRENNLKPTIIIIREKIRKGQPEDEMWLSTKW